MRRNRFVPGLVLLSATAVGAALTVGPVVGSASAREVPTTTYGDEVHQVRRPEPKREVMTVGNNWDGTVTIVDASTHEPLTTLNVAPDKDQELQEIYTNPDRLAFYLAIQQAVGEGHDQYVDDVFTTRNGKYIAVSRPSLADVVWIDVAKAAAAGPEGDPDSIVAEQPMDGYRTDHMGVSPDRRRLLVSDSTERQVIEFSMVNETLSDGTKVHMGDRLRSFESGDTPHESNYSADGERIFHASIGRVYTPGDEADSDPVGDTTKGDRWLEIVRNSDFKIMRRWDMGQELAEAGHPGMSSAIRPVAFTPDERIMYAQVSFYHGLVEFNFGKLDPTGGGDYTLGGMPEPKTGVVTRIIDLPISEEAKNTPRDQYLLDSAHHGLASNARGTKLCVAGTMSDYAAIVDRKTFTPKLFKGDARYVEGEQYKKPYWAVRGPGNTCWMSMSGSDLVTIISFGKEKVIDEVPVGDHPQRVREGSIRESILQNL